MKHLFPLALPFFLFTLLTVQSLPAAGQNHENELLSMYFAEDELVESATRAPNEPGGGKRHHYHGRGDPAYERP